MRCTYGRSVVCKGTRAHYFVNNQVRLPLFALAYSLGDFLCGLALPKSVQHRSLTT